MFQSHDQEEAVWGGGQLAAGSGQRARTFPQVYGHTPDQTAFREVTYTNEHTHTSHFIRYMCSSLSSSSHGQSLVRISFLVATGWFLLTAEKQLKTGYTSRWSMLLIASCLCRYCTHTGKHGKETHWIGLHYARISSIVREKGHTISEAVFISMYSFCICVWKKHFFTPCSWD